MEIWIAILLCIICLIIGVGGSLGIAYLIQVSKAKKKAEEEAAKKDARIEELERQIATDALRKSVAADVEAMPEGIAVTQDFLDLVVTGDADTSNANVKKLVGILLADRKSQEEKRATGRTPKSYGNNGGALSEIDKRIAKYK